MTFCRDTDRLQKMIEMYEAGYSQEDIAEQFGIRQAAVSYHFRRHRVQTRQPGDYWRGKTAAQYRQEMIERQLREYHHV